MDIVMENCGKMPTEHELKILSEHYALVCSGQKTFEIRKNDRDFQVGDILVLREFSGQEYISYSSSIRARVVYLTSFEQKEGYVVMGIELEKME